MIMNQHQYTLPKLKPFVEFCAEDNKIHFFNGPGLAIELDDASGFVAAVCSAMDGLKSYTQIAESVSATHPKETPLKLHY